MESLFSLPSFQRRLTKMYTDTKSSYDFVKEPVPATEEDPELLSLHRKLRIQKDRLVSWGLEWSDPSQSPDIDESINKAGLSELVGSVMGTIKEILAEAEPLWQSGKRASLGSLGIGEEKGMSLAAMGKERESKQNLMVWDKSRFQDLVRDLTMSIDTLYDLSRTRQSARQARPGARREPSESMVRKIEPAEEKLFESTRMQTPQQIDPKSLIWPRDMKSIQPGLLPPAKATRQIIFMRRPMRSTELRKLGQPLPVVPVLMEFAPYDSIYSITGISPPMSRFEKLFAAISQSYISTERDLAGLLGLIGYFEEAEHSRFCLLYALPSNFGPIDIESPRMPSIIILSDLFYSNNHEPTLEVKYRLAHNVATAVFDLHSKGVVHGNVMASNVLFVEPQTPRLDLNHVNMRQSFLTSCDLFSETATDGSESTLSTSLHRHPLDPRTTRYTSLTSDSKSLDLYSLAMLLLEIGLWTSLHDIFPTVSALPENPAAVFKQLASRCGSLYVKAVQACWHAPVDELSQKARPDVMHQKVFCKVSKALDTCCAIDESSDEEVDEDDYSPPMPSTPITESFFAPRRMLVDQKSASISNLAASASATRRPSWNEKPAIVKTPSYPPEKVGWTDKPLPVLPIAPRPAAPIKVEKSKVKLRTYPSIRIAQEHLDFWHTGLIPHINHVLRHFYKKYPESVEISLESIGESSSTTKPTILIICTSVTKVRNILKKSLIYDKTTFGLKVCRGKVVRSRKHGVKRSMMNDAGEIKASFGEHQERPSNGASIGAFVNNHHLPPVSFGGLIMVDDKPYGMTVHHMLDDPSDDEESEIDEAAPILRSSAAAAYLDMPDLTYSESSYYSSGDGDEEYMYSLSDYGSTLGDSASDYQDSEAASEYASDVDEENFDMEAGDILGIPAGCGEEYLITQPAIDDVSEGFYPDPETRDDDHLDSCQLGEVYASSGIRRRTENDTIHEIDWALFEFSDDRLPSDNHIPNGSRYCAASTSTYPLSIAPVSDLGGLDVHCNARTSGLKSGRILPGMVIVKIFGRQTPSSSFAVAGRLGIPGDSGAWVVDNERGRACGHVLAWSTRKKVAYIAPMEVSIRDIGETLGARSIYLPGGNQLFGEEASVGSASNTIRAETMSFDEAKFGNQNQMGREMEVGIEDELSQMMKELNLPPTRTQIDELSVYQPMGGTKPKVTDIEIELDEEPQYSSTYDHHSPAVSPVTPSPLDHSDNTNPFIPIKLMTRDGAKKTAHMSKEQHMDFLKVWGGMNEEHGEGSRLGGSRSPNPGVGVGSGVAAEERGRETLGVVVGAS